MTHRPARLSGRGRARRRCRSFPQPQPATSAVSAVGFSGAGHRRPVNGHRAEHVGSRPPGHSATPRDLILAAGAQPIHADSAHTGHCQCWPGCSSLSTDQGTVPKPRRWWGAPVGGQPSTSPARFRVAATDDSSPGWRPTGNGSPGGHAALATG